MTNEQGFFAIAGVKPGSYTAVISKEIYLDGETPDITVEEKAVTRVQLKLGRVCLMGSVKAACLIRLVLCRSDGDGLAGRPGIYRQKPEMTAVMKFRT